MSNVQNKRRAGKFKTMNRFPRGFSRPDLYLAPATRIDVPIRELTVPAPAEWHGRTALFVSDIHLRNGMDAKRLTERMNAVQADLILLGGDYADTRSEALRLFHAFRRLHAPLGIFAVCGNNDVEAFGSHEALSEALSSFGARLLVNQSQPVDGVWIGGADECRYGAPDYTNLFPQEVPSQRRILLSHYPLHNGLTQAHPALMLSGHTHGGQFNAFGLTPYSIGFESFGKNARPPVLVSGAKRFDETLLLVSKGVGGSRIPLRVGVRPEMHRISFQASAKKC